MLTYADKTFHALELFLYLLYVDWNLFVAFSILQHDVSGVPKTEILNISSESLKIWIVLDKPIVFVSSSLSFQQNVL